jgi:hypothetical protein
VLTDDDDEEPVNEPFPLPTLFSSTRPRAANSMQENDDFWYSSLETPPPSNFTPGAYHCIQFILSVMVNALLYIGLIPIIKDALFESLKSGNTQQARLCYEKIVHVALESWDRSWGKGWV